MEDTTGNKRSLVRVDSPIRQLQPKQASSIKYFLYSVLVTTVTFWIFHHLLSLFQRSPRQTERLILPRKDIQLSNEGGAKTSISGEEGWVIKKVSLLPSLNGQRERFSLTCLQQQYTYMCQKDGSAITPSLHIYVSLSCPGVCTISTPQSCA